MARITAQQGLPMFQMPQLNANFDIDPLKYSQSGGLKALEDARNMIERSKVPGLLEQAQQGGQVDPTTLARIRAADPQAAQGLVQASQENRARQMQERNMRQFDFQDEAEKQKFGAALAIQTAQKMQSVEDASSKRAIMEVAKRTAQRAGLDVSELPQDVEQFEQYVSKFQQKYDERQNAGEDLKRQRLAFDMLREQRITEQDKSKTEAYNERTKIQREKNQIDAKYRADKETLKQTNKLFDGFKKDRLEFDKFNTQMNQIDILKGKLSKGGLSGPEQYALMMRVGKLLDPDSVFREGEFATLANSGDAYQGILRTIQGLRGNPSLATPEMAADLFALIDSLRGEVDNTFYDVRNDYGLKAQRGKLDPLDVLGNTYGQGYMDDVKAIEEGSQGEDVGFDQNAYESYLGL
jgi:hypothetical protein